MPRKNKSTRGRGRPRLEVHKEFKTVSVPEELWNECRETATAYGVSVSHVACNRIRGGEYDPSRGRKDEINGYEFEG